MTRVFWDTNLFVYLFEGGAFAARVKQVRSRMLERGDQLVTLMIDIPAQDAELKQFVEGWSRKGNDNPRARLGA